MNLILRAARACAVSFFGIGTVVTQSVLHTIPMPSGFHVVTMCGDVDHDGVNDIAVNDYTTGVAKVFSVRAGSLVRSLVPAMGGSFWVGGRMGDWDGDGVDDMIGYSPGQVPTVWSGRNGSVLVQFSPPWAIGCLDDINRDGRADILLSDPFALVNGMQNAGRIDILDGMTRQIVRSHIGGSPDQNLHTMGHLGDMDGDGVLDYCIYDRMWLRGFSGASGSALFVLPRWSATYGEQMTDAGDLDGDGFDDIVFRDRGGWPHTAYESIHVFAGPDASRQLWSHTTWLMNPGPVYYHSHVGKIGDMDGDGHDDLGLVGGGPGVSSTILSGRDFSVIWEQTTTTSSLPGILSYGLTGPGDVDGDGVPDVLMRGAWTPQTPFVALVSFAMPGVTPLGSPCPGPLGMPPRIGIGVGARLGQTMTVNLSDANPNLHFALLGAGFSNQQWQGIPLPLDLGGFGLPGCFWRVAADVSLLVPTSGGSGTLHRATHAVPIPAHPAQLGTQMFWQWLVVEPAPLGLTASTTRAMRSVVVQ